ncbi:MAG: hypothetical protein K2X27_18550 [Candidatus Obscuribacterales bacterium]|nr:hypothetical protein [Candidatus Obscuribacterales bacterium]
MSAVKQHQDWLSLLEVSGPFIALPILKRVFPHGLPKLESNLKKELRIAHQEWQNSQEDTKLRTSYNTAWIRYVLREILGYPTNLLAEGAALPGGYEVYLSEHGEKLQPDAAIIIPEGRENQGRARILVAIYPSNQSLERALPQSKSKWAASPATRMMELLRRTSVKLGLVTNGEQWMLVYAPFGETTTFVSWYASIWLEEESTLQSFLALMSVARTFGTADEETTEALFRQSTEFQQEVSDQLGLQVRKAVELLIQALDRIDKDTGRSLLSGVSENELYEAGVSVMMRLVFMLAAEERSLFPLNFEVYSANYAVSTLREQLHDSASRHGEAVLEHRYDAWNRLLSGFRLIFGGARHEDLNSPAYGGSLFDPDRYPFLEGRQKGTKWYESQGEPLAINNRVVLHLLDSIQLLKGKGPNDEARKLSFRAIDVEQIGNVYESLLEHTAVRAEEPVLGLVGSKGKEPEVPLSVLKSKKESGDDEFVRWLCDETGKTEKALRKIIYETDKFSASKCLMVCDNDETVYQAIKPFIGLIREDTVELPVIFTQGSVYVTEGAQRRSTGTHYTPRSLTEAIVEHALTPLVYVGYPGGAEATRNTLLTPQEILELKICDIACGSGAFLVQACRYLGDKLVESWAKCEDNLAAGCRIDIYDNEVVEGSLSDEKLLLPKSQDERQILARRLVADRCLFGVDCNPMAVEMAKLSLWLTTLERNRPFTFLDHAIKCGDSLAGLTRIEQFKYFEFLPDLGKPPRRLSQFTGEMLETAKQLRQKLECITDGDICDTDSKARLHKQAESLLHKARMIGDILTSVSLAGAGTGIESMLDNISLKIAALLSGNLAEEQQVMQLKLLLEQTRNGLRTIPPFHWVIEFPEVFHRERSGFDSIIGNPPFMNGYAISGTLTDEYREFIIRNVSNGRRGSADLCTYFLLRAAELIHREGVLGLITTNSISEGDTREVGLDQICSKSYQITRAISSLKWPGVANLEVALLWICSLNWLRPCSLNGTSVDNIGPYLSANSVFVGKPFNLIANSGRSFNGYKIYGDGFVISEQTVEELLKLNGGAYKQIIFPYINAEDINTRVNQSPSRKVINFFDWPLKRDSRLPPWYSCSAEQRNEFLKEGIVPADYAGPVASDYPAALEIVEKEVRPERTRKDKEGNFVTRYPLYHKWWIYGEKRPALKAACENLSRVLAIPIVSKYLIMCWQPSSFVYSHALSIVATQNDSMFSILQSTIHEIWARQCGSTLETRMRYTPSDCFETFPFPNETEELNQLGKVYNETRQRLTQQFQEGLTKIYNRVHAKSEKHSVIQEFRELHRKLDEAVIRAYGWTDIALDHDFRSTDRGDIFTISEHCKQQLLERLFKLNQERHTEEEAAGLGKKGKSTRKTKKTAKSETQSSEKQITLDLRERSVIGAPDNE